MTRDYPVLMPLRLTPGDMDHSRGTLPLYVQLADHIRQAITSDDLRPADDLGLEPLEALPASEVLQRMAGVSDIVVRQALDELAAEGLVVRRKGARTRVAEPPQVRRVDADRYVADLRQIVAGETPDTSFVTDHGATWEDYTITNVEYSVEDASESDQRLLDLKPGDKVMRRRMVKCLWDKPYQLHRSAVSLDNAQGTVLADSSRQPVPGGTLAELVEAGFVPTSVVELIPASRRPDNTERRLLQMEAGDVWKIERVFYVDGRPIEASRSIGPAARSVLRFETDLRLG